MAATSIKDEDINDDQINWNPDNIFDEFQYIKGLEFVFNGVQTWDSGMWKKLDELKRQLILHEVKLENRHIFEPYQNQFHCDNNNHTFRGSSAREYRRSEIETALYRLGQKIHENIKAHERAQMNSDSQSESSERNNDQRKRKELLIFDRSNPKNWNIDENGTLFTVSKERAVYKKTSINRQAFMLFVITKVIPLIHNGDYVTKRDLYYIALGFCTSLGTNPSSVRQDSSSQNFLTQDQPLSDMNVKCNPNILNDILEDICCIIGCSQINLNILTSSKGIVYGNLKFELESGECFDCASGPEGVTIPNAKSAIIHIESKAKFILVIEKDAILQRLVDRKFSQRFDAILLTGKGYPDANTRAFLKFLWLKLKIPALILTVADPYGIEIACVYKFGSINLVHEAHNLALPELRWLGLLPTDLHNLKLKDRDEACQNLGARDKRKLVTLSERPYFAVKKRWLDQIKFMAEFGKKAEIEAVDQISDEYLLETYLPNKIRQGSWI